MKWLRNALIALLRQAVRAELTEQRSVEVAHVTELVGVLDKAADQLSHTLTREAMRKSRALAREAKAETEGQPGGTAAPATAESDLTPKQRARARWQQLRQQQGG